VSRMRITVDSDLADLFLVSLVIEGVYLAGVPEGGMGIEIIRQAMDEASYSTNSGTNCLRLTKFLRRSHSVEAPA
jgi:anti-sigma regulatory factor (Ser/Thr protein kinase)